MQPPSLLTPLPPLKKKKKKVTLDTVVGVIKLWPLLKFAVKRKKG